MTQFCQEYVGYLQQTTSRLGLIHSISPSPMYSVVFRFDPKIAEGINLVSCNKYVFLLSFVTSPFLSTNYFLL